MRTVDDLHALRPFAYELLAVRVNHDATGWKAAELRLGELTNAGLNAERPPR